MTNSQDISLPLGTALYHRGTGHLLDAYGVEIQLSPLSQAILDTLVAQMDETIPKDALISIAGGSATVTDESLVEHIAEIRRAIGDTDRTLIQTMPGVGYKLCSIPPSPPPRKGNTLKYIGLAIALLPVVAILAQILLSAF